MGEHSTRHSPIKEFFKFMPAMSIILIVYFLLNYYVVSSYYGFFDFEKNFSMYILILGLSFIYIISMAMEMLGDNVIFKSLYYLSSVLMGVLFIAFVTTLIYDLIGLVIKMDGFTEGILGIITIFILSVYSLINNYIISVKVIPLHNNKNASMRIVQITDIHLGPIYGEKRLEGIVKKVNELNPDLVLMTGDLLDGRYKYKSDILKSLNDIKSDIYFIYGNHDVYAGLDRLEKLLSITKVRWLHNESIQYENIDIIGIDDTSEEKVIGGMLYSMNMHKKIGSRFTILMTHRPVGWREASKYVDLMIAGHTHAGQIWPFNYLAFLQNGASKGIYRTKTNNRFMLYVSPGTGTWGPPMRIGSNTEITVFELKRENYSKK